jgi:hypothetical protein
VVVLASPAPPREKRRYWGGRVPTGRLPKPLHHVIPVSETDLKYGVITA